MENPSDITQAQFDMVKKFVDALYSSSDRGFLWGLLEAVSQNKAPAYVAQHGYDISKPNNWKALKAMAMAGPHFDLRLAGGVYRFEDNALGLSELFVNSCKKTVHVDGELMQSVKVNDGVVAFSNSSGRSFNLRFHCPQLFAEKFSEPRFEGQTFTTGGASTKATISGKRYYPWGQAGKQTTKMKPTEKENIPAVMKSITDEKVLAAAMVRVNAMVDSIAVCMDLMTGHYDEPVKMVEYDATQNDISVYGIIDVAIPGFGLLLNVGCMGIGGYIKAGKEPLDMAVGAGFLGIGASAVVVALAAFNYWCVTKQSMEMRDWIRRYGVKDNKDEEAPLLTGNVVTETVRREVRNLSPLELKDDNKTHVAVIRSKVETAYTREVKAELGQPALERFSWYQWAAGDKYRKQFDDETEAKFKADIGPEEVEKLINQSIDEARAAGEKESLGLKLAELQGEKQMLEFDKGQSLKELKNTEGSQASKDYEREKAKIEEKYKKDLGEKEDKEKKLEKKKRKAERVVEAKLPEKTAKDMIKTMNQRRENELEAQNLSRKKVPRGK